MFSLFREQLMSIHRSQSSCLLSCATLEETIPSVRLLRLLQQLVSFS